MIERFGQLVSRYWWAIILVWAAGLLFVTWTTPKWDTVTLDGDLAYLPPDLSSVAGEAMLDKAFPVGRSKSEMVVVVARENRVLTVDDISIVDRLAARLKNLLGASHFQAHLAFSSDRQAAGDNASQFELREKEAIAAWQQALELDPECAEAWNNLAYQRRLQGDEEQASKHAQMATDFDPSIVDAGTGLLPDTGTAFPMLDVWTYRHDVFGEQLGSADRRAQLIVVRLSQEFMAVENIALFEQLRRIIAEIRNDSPDGLQIGITGSAAVGSEMLQSAGESIANTERSTVILVVVILLVVYRSPLLVTVPLVTIVVSVVVATRLVAALTQLDLLPGFEWWNFKVFTTTKIFVVVILFGAGTDFCLFLISRFREELESGHSNSEAIAKTVSGVSIALIGSALTTIVGLGMMYFAEFGKFRNSGPAIGFCLAITLCACLTLGPALVRAMGSRVFWPSRIGDIRRSRPANRMNRFWDQLARMIVSYPVRVLSICTLVMLPLVVVGTSVEVTYNFLSELSPTKPSRVGTELIRRHFPKGQTGPLVVLAKTTERSLTSDDGKSAILELTKELYVDGVDAVRSWAAPRGIAPDGFSIRTAAIQAHEVTRSLYLSEERELGGEVARFELVLKSDPFSLESIDVLNRVESLVARESTDDESFWNAAEFRFTGTTSAIRDLRAVTRGDNLRIQILVVLGVLTVLLMLLKKPAISIYLIISVLFSYYATLGITELFFKHAYGSTFEGLDWKVPLFLFVILVAIGQDYNIYLITRVFEEQEQHGQFGGLRRAIVRTGGIITSCGVIMAGTFISMTTGSLRGIVELGFALSVGVLLDTFIVRPILVPAFLALLFRISAANAVAREPFGIPRPSTSATP